VKGTRVGTRPDRCRWAWCARVVLLLTFFAAPARTAAQQTATNLAVDSLSLLGVISIDPDALRSVLATRESSWLPWRTPRYFDPESFELDLRRIVAYYQDRGFPDARVVSQEVDVDSRAQQVDIRIRVEEGEPDRIAEVQLEGFEAITPEDQRALRDALPIEPGAIAVRSDILAGGEQAVSVLKNQGFPYATVRVEQRTVDPHRVRVRYEATPGARAFFGAIDVVGNLSVDDDIVRRQLAYRPGELFRLDRVQESQRRVYGLELFQFATVDAVEAGTPVDVPTRVTVTEGDHRRLDLSVGWGTEERLRGEAAWRHVNFYGGARTLATRAKWSALEQGGEFDFRQPYLFAPGLALSLNGHTWYANELAYTARSSGGRMSVDGRPSRTVTWTATYAHEFTSSRISNAALLDLTQRDVLIALGLNPTTGRQEGVHAALSLNLQRVTTDSLLDPRHGYSAAIQLEQAGTVLPGDYNYSGLTIDVRGYLPRGDSVVLAGRVHAGTLDPAGSPMNVPFFKRYFLGGSTSLRGWGRFEVSPLSGPGLPIGGLSMFEASAEIRAAAWRGLGLVGFVDAGNVWSDAWEWQPGDLRYDAGPGLRYPTPVGPLRVDLAYQLTPTPELLVDGRPQQRRWRVHFSIGQSF